MRNNLLNKIKKINNLLLIFCTVILFLLLISLGFWQLKRLDEKTYFINSIAHNITAPAISFEQIDKDQLLYSKINVRGYFITNQDIYLYGRSMDKQNGYYLISPFITDTGKVILVARGWFNAKDKNQIANLINSTAPEILTAIVLKGESKRYFVPENDFRNNIWFTLDLKDAAHSLGRDIEDFYLIQIYPNNYTVIDNIKPIRIENLLKIRNDHLEYAITWFSLSIALIITFAIYQKRNAIIL